jgi:hypothetical protein
MKTSVTCLKTLDKIRWFFYLFMAFSAVLDGLAALAIYLRSEKGV